VSEHLNYSTPSPEKNGTTIFLSLTLPTDNRFLKFFHRQTCWKIYEKAIVKYPITPQTRRYTTLWNVCAQESQLPKAEWSELPCNTLPVKTFAERILPNDVNNILFTGEKILTMTTQKNSQNDQLYAQPSTKKKDFVTKRLRTQLASSQW